MSSKTLVQASAAWPQLLEMAFGGEAVRAFSVFTSPKSTAGEKFAVEDVFRTEARSDLIKWLSRVSL